MTPLILSLFPGADLFGRAFETWGCCVARGPDLLFGQDVRDWNRPPPGVFDGIIGGPPCAPFTTLRRKHQPSRHDDCVPIFWDIVRECRPAFAVMENVLGVRGHKAIPWSAVPLVFTDWDCFGLTNRKRVFYVWPQDVGRAVEVPPRCKDRTGVRSLLASDGKGKLKISAETAAELQCYPEIYDVLQSQADAGAKGNRLIPKRLIVYMLGNGVPRMMGERVAYEVLKSAKMFPAGGEGLPPSMGAPPAARVPRPGGADAPDVGSTPSSRGGPPVDRGAPVLAGDA